MCPGRAHLAWVPGQARVCEGPGSERSGAPSPRGRCAPAVRRGVRAPASPPGQCRRRTRAERRRGPGAARESGTCTPRACALTGRVPYGQRGGRARAQRSAVEVSRRPRGGAEREAEFAHSRSRGPRGRGGERERERGTRLRPMSAEMAWGRGRAAARRAAVGGGGGGGRGVRPRPPLRAGPAGRAAPGPGRHLLR